jgi:hypothetical protein
VTSTKPRRLSGLTLYLAAVLVLVVAMTGSATAGALITSRQIKDNTITTKDIKNGTLRLGDINKATRSQLRGKNGTNGKNGAPGASAYKPPPSGTLVTGSYVHYDAPTAQSSQRAYIALPFPLATDLEDTQLSTRNLWAAPGTLFRNDDENATVCAGTTSDPDPAPGNLCVYVAEGSAGSTNAAVDTGHVVAGIGGLGDAGRKSGFQVSYLSGGAGATTLRLIWAYRAP